MREVAGLRLVALDLLCKVPLVAELLDLMKLRFEEINVLFLVL